MSVLQQQVDPNEFVNNLKSLASAQTNDDYSEALKRLMKQVKQSTPNGSMENKPLALTAVDHFHRLIPIFDQKLSNNDEQTKVFLETLANNFDGTCLFGLFSAIKEPSRLERIFRNYLPALKEKYFLDHPQYDHLVNCFLPILCYSSILISIEDYGFPSNFLTFLLEFTKKHWQDKSRTEIVKNVLILIKILSKSLTFLPTIIASEWPNACVEWLKTSGPRPVFDIDLMICMILQKMARHANGVLILNQLDCMQVLKSSKTRMQEAHTPEQCSSIHFIQSITYALLIESDEIKQKAMLNDQVMSKILEQLIDYIIQSSQTDAVVFKGCHISEILCVLSKLFVNDDILQRCLEVNSRLFDSLCQLLIHFTMLNTESSKIYQAMNAGALTTTANLLWSISFHSSYQKRFKANPILMHTLSNLATSSSLYVSSKVVKSTPTDICPLKQAAEGILWNLKVSHPIKAHKNAEEQSSVMISYSHSDGTFCRELVEQLSSHLSVWVDYNQLQHGGVHSDDLWEDIARAMEMATVIILIVSHEYYNSKSCRQELSYATDTLKKRIIPIYAPEQKYKAAGWLGIRIAGQKYVHFGRKIFNAAFEELVSLVNPDEKPGTVSCTPCAVDPVKPVEHELSPKNWTSKEIRKWFDDNHVHADLVALFSNRFHTGTALIAYAHHLKQCYRSEFMQILTNYHTQFNGKQLQTVDFITFVDALWRLREENDPQSKNEDAWERQMNRQSSYSKKMIQESLTWFWIL